MTVVQPKPNLTSIRTSYVTVRLYDVLFFCLSAVSGQAQADYTVITN
jgi:hypothetical protein